MTALQLTNVDFSAYDASQSAGRDFRLYVHIPFCTHRCGYCDFNTYTAKELGPGANQLEYYRSVLSELDRARDQMAEIGAPQRQISSIFFGGGTPTLLPAAHLVEIITAARAAWGFAEGLEITVEANPDTLSLQYLEQLRAGGVTRVSIGMQSAVPHVLQVLDRTHDPEQVPKAVQWAKQAGLEVSVDLIYGAPGESLADWETSVRAALDMRPDHVSAYALIIEVGTKMERQMRCGQLPYPDDDDQADKYLLTDKLLSEAGYQWYEVSNWSQPGKASRHNLGYWMGDDWWGLGPGAYSQLGHLRWANLKHPLSYAKRLETSLPVTSAELLTAADLQVELVMLRMRLARGMGVHELSASAQAEIPGMIEQGLLEKNLWDAQQRVVLTLKGRLLADFVIKKFVW